MDLLVLPIALTVAGSVGLLTFLAYLRLAGRSRVVASRSSGGQPDTAMGTDSPLLQSRRSMPLANLLPLSQVSEERTGRELARAGWRLRVNEYLTVRLASGLGGGVAGIILLIRMQPDSGLIKFGLILLALLLFLVGWMIPRFLLSRARKKRLERIDQQLPDALLAMAKSLQVGTGFLQALSNAANEVPAPLGAELQRTVRDLQLGADAEEVFTALGERIGSPDVDILVTAIVIQRTTGGNLSEILLNVCNTVRERAELREEVMTLTATERLTGNIMAALPVLVAVGFMVMQPDMGRLLYETTIGRIAVVVAIILEIIGIIIIRKLANIKI